jgi:hypothetical protein
MSGNNALEMVQPKDTVVQNDNMANISQQAFTSTRGDFHAAFAKNDNAQKTVDSQFGTPMLFDSATLAKDWDQAAKTGDFSKSDAELKVAIQHAYKDGGTAGVDKLQDDLAKMTKTADAGPLISMNGDTVTVRNIHTESAAAAQKDANAQYDNKTGLFYDNLSTPNRFDVNTGDYVRPTIHGRESASSQSAEMTTQRPSMTVGADGTAVEAPKPQHDQMTARPNLTMGADGTAVEVPTPAAEAKINNVVDDLKNNSSADQIAEDLQAALKAGANLNELVEEVNNKVGHGFKAGHMHLTNVNGVQGVDVSHGIGGNHLNVNGTNVTKGNDLK